MTMFTWTWDLNVDTPEGILIAGGSFVAMMIVWLAYEYISERRADNKKGDNK